MKERNFDEFLSAVYFSAEEKSKKMIREIDEASSSALRSYTDEMRRASAERRRREDARAAAAGAADTSRRASAIRQSLFARREEIAHEVFDEVAKRVADYTGSPAYKDALIRDAKAIADTLGGADGAKLAVREADMCYAADITAACGLEVVCDSRISLGGVRGLSGDIECDLTLDCKMSMAKEKFMRESGLTVV